MCVALSRDVVDAVLLVPNLHHKRVCLMDLGERADPVRGEELVLIEEVLENTCETVFGWNGEQMTELALVKSVEVSNL